MQRLLVFHTGDRGGSNDEKKGPDKSHLSGEAHVHEKNQFKAGESQE